MNKLSIDEIGYLSEIRQRLGLEKGDTIKDKFIADAHPLWRVGKIADSIKNSSV